MASISINPRTGNIIVRAYAGKDPVTKATRQISKTVAAGSSQDVIDAAVEAVELRAGFARKMGSRYTIGGLVKYYLEGCLDYGKSPTTVASYCSAARCYVYPRLGKITFDKASPSDFSELYRYLLHGGGKDGSPLSAQTVKKLHAFLSGCFSTLAADGVIDASPLAGVKVPRGSSPEAVPLSEQDFSKLIGHLTSVLSRSDGAERTQAASIWVCLHTGVRRGELAGFRVGDFRAGAEPTIRVARSVVQVSRSGSSLLVKEPKSKSGKRVLSLDTSSAALISDHLTMQAVSLAKLGVTQSADTPLFADDAGEIIRPSGFTAYFSKLRNKLGLSKAAHLHTLRHTHATYLLEHGTNIKTVQERLGHSKIDVTLGVYGHVLPGRDSKAADDFGDLSKTMMQQPCNAQGTTLAPICPLSGETCARFV